MSGAAIMRLRKERFEALTCAENADQTMFALTERIAKGTHTFAQICVELDVPYARFLVWLQADEGRWGAFLKTHEARSINYVDEALHIADDDSQDTLVSEGGRVSTNHEAIMRSKLRVETRFKYAQHYAPGLFGKKVQHEHTASGDLGERLRRAKERLVPPAPPEAEDAEVVGAPPVLLQGGESAAAE